MRTLFSLVAGSLLAGSALLLAADANTGRKAPELSFNIPGKGVQQLSQYKGKVVALEFIFTTCPHCQAASKVMTRYQQEFAARGFQAIDIAVNPNADLLVENFVKDYQVGFPVGWIPQNEMTAFMGFADGRYVVPQLALIDRKGVIRFQTPAQETGEWDKLMKEETLKQHIEELLNEGSSTKAGRTSARSTVAQKHE